METGKKNYILYFDLLNIFACFAVVALHVNGAVHTFAKTRNWVSCMFIEALFYFAVPVFFMLTGATLINYRKRYYLEYHRNMLVNILYKRNENFRYQYTGKIYQCRY